MLRLAALLVSVSSVLFVARVASADVPTGRHAAEEALLPSNARPPPRPTPGVKGTALAASYDEGFRLRTNDGSTELRFAWSAQLDGRLPMGASTAPTSFDMRRARLDLIATISRRLFVRVGLAAEDATYLRNAFGDYEVGEWLHVRVGQMKVPLSTEWATFDNHVNFIERAHAQPIHPFIDRGVLLWGKLPGSVLTWNVGAFAGAGVDADAPRGDLDDGKELAFRLFAQPLRNAPARAVRGLYFVTQGTWETASVATRRFELRGLASPTFESNVWRWRGDKGEVEAKARVGAEVHYVNGPFTLSGEASTLRWTGARPPDSPRTSGGVLAASAWASVFLTGESKVLDNFGWRQPNPRRPVFGGDPDHAGSGAVELLARASMIRTDDSLSTVLEGARRMNEITLGASWTLAYAAKLQLNFVHTWAPTYREGADGILSGASSELADPARRGALVPSESLLALRAIFRI